MKCIAEDVTYSLQKPSGGVLILATWVGHCLRCNVYGDVKYKFMEYFSLFHSTVTAGVLVAKVFLWNIRILHTYVAEWYKSPCNSRREMAMFSVAWGATKPWIPCIYPHHFTVLTWLLPRKHKHTVCLHLYDKIWIHSLPSLIGV